MSALKTLVASERRHLAELLQHLAEVDSRRLHLPAACPSMFEYCVRELGYSEGAAYNRIRAARAARRFPVLLSAISDGRLHLAAVVALAGYLTRENIESLVAASTHLRKREVEQLIASRFPKPDVKTIMKPLSCQMAQPSAAPEAGAAVTSPPPLPAAPEPELPHARLFPGTVGMTMPEQVAPPAAHAPALPSVRIQPTSATRFALQTAIDASTQAKLKRAQDLLGHAVPSGDVGAILDRALDLLIAKLERERFAQCETPRAARRTQTLRPRTIPAELRRQVWKRDGGCCTFTSESGQRCGSRMRLEFDHARPLAKGGVTSLENLRLRCRAHNQYDADRAFGAGFMQRKRPA